MSGRKVREQRRAERAFGVGGCWDGGVAGSFKVSFVSLDVRSRTDVAPWRAARAASGRVELASGRLAPSLVLQLHLAPASATASLAAPAARALFD